MSMCSLKLNAEMGFDQSEQTLTISVHIYSCLYSNVQPPDTSLTTEAWKV